MAVVWGIRAVGAGDTDRVEPTPAHAVNRPWSTPPSRSPRRLTRSQTRGVPPSAAIEIVAGTRRAGTPVLATRPRVYAFSIAAHGDMAVPESRVCLVVQPMICRMTNHRRMSRHLSVMSGGRTRHIPGQGFVPQWGSIISVIPEPMRSRTEILEAQRPALSGERVRSLLSIFRRQLLSAGPEDLNRQVRSKE
jgi:hypothetical protein